MLEKIMRKLKKNNWIAFLAIFCGVLLWSAFKADEETLVIRGGKIVTVTQGVIEQGILLIQKGKIVEIGKNISMPNDARIIDASKYPVFPGFIDSFTNLGAVDIETIEKDYDEATSPVTPELKIIDAIDPANSFIPAARKIGITTVLAAPGIGNLLSGQSALVHLAGKDIIEMIVKFPVAVNGSLGEPPKLRYGKKEQLPSTRMGEAALIRQTFVDTQDYLNEVLAYQKKLKEHEQKEKEGKSTSEEKPALPAANFKLQALVPVITGELPLILTANRMDDILTALRIADEFKLKIILNEGADAHKVKDKLSLKNIPVLLRPRAAYRLTVETEGALYENAALLQKAGIKIAFQTGSVQNLGDLLYQAQMAISHGLPYKEALKALTINPAEIFGVSDKIGSLEKGKCADIVIFDGDPLISPAQIRMVIIAGQIVENKM